jgi:hypothetical protein
VLWLRDKIEEWIKRKLIDRAGTNKYIQHVVKSFVVAICPVGRERTFTSSQTYIPMVQSAGVLCQGTFLFRRSGARLVACEPWLASDQQFSTV